MKRFYCTICRKVKRVRNYPTNIQNEDAYLPENRKGECNRHAEWSGAKAEDRLYRKAGAR